MGSVKGEDRYVLPVLGEMYSWQIVFVAVGLPVRFDDRLKELHAGVFQGHLWSELDWRFPEAAAGRRPNGAAT